MPLSALRGVGASVAEKLAARGLCSVQDLWLHLPLRYEDRTRLTPIRELQSGVPAQVDATVEAVERGFRYRPVLRVAVGDGSHATPVLRFFHFRAAQAAQFRPGVRLRCFGTPRPGQHGLEIVHPSYRVLGDDEEPSLGDSLDPVYPAVEGVGPATLRRLIGQALDLLPEAAALELLPSALPGIAGLPGLRESLLLLHRPPPGADLTALAGGTHPAQRRLTLEELLAHHLSLRRQRLAQQALHACALDGPGCLRSACWTSCRSHSPARSGACSPIGACRPYQLWQARCSGWCRATWARARPWSRHWPPRWRWSAVAGVALAAPTELLAEQHLTNLRAWLEPLGIRVAWLAGKVTGKARTQALAEVASGAAQVVVGTHALMQEGRGLPRPALL